jgi:hypothetical protein
LRTRTGRNLCRITAEHAKLPQPAIGCIFANSSGNWGGTLTISPLHQRNTSPLLPLSKLKWGKAREQFGSFLSQPPPKAQRWKILARHRDRTCRKIVDAPPGLASGERRAGARQQQPAHSVASVLAQAGRTGKRLSTADSGDPNPLHDEL